MYLVQVVVLCLCCFYFTNAEFSVTAVEPKIHTLRNREIALECAVIGGDGVRWRDKDGRQYYMSQIDMSAPVPDDQKYKFEVAGNVYKMIIRGVQPSDDGVYVCGAKPLDDSTGSFTWATIAVNIFVKPGTPDITGVGGAYTEPVAAGQEVITVSVPKGVADASIKCTVGPAKPAINIKWLKQGQEFTEGISDLVTTVDSETLETTSSILTISGVTPSNTGEQYKCVADLSTLPAPFNSGDSPYKTFNLSIQTVPSDPIIENYQDSIRQPGDVVVLRCRTIGGNPFPSHRWYRNDVLLPVQYQTFEDRNVVESELNVTVTASDNNAKYKCEVNNPALDTPIENTVTFRVHFPPKKVTITGHEQVKVGDTITLSCTTSNSNPAADITWYRQGIVLADPDEVSDIKESSDGGYITQTNITVLADRASHFVDYMCRASNDQLNDYADESVKLDVLYPPVSIAITGFNSSRAVLVDEAHTMVCTSIEGNPLPDLVWYKGDTVITNNLDPVVTRGKTRSRELAFIARPEDNGVTYKCEAQSAATASPVKEDSIKVMVYYPPQDVVITSNGPMKEGISVTLTCNSGTSYPECDIVWSKNDSDVYAGTRKVEVRDGSFGGKITISSYTFTPQASDNGLVVKCNARNTEIRRSTTQTMPLNVLHKPIFVGVKKQLLDVEEGKNLTDIDFLAKGNPAEMTYTWFTVSSDNTETELKFEAKRDGTVNGLKVVGGVLSLHNINRDRAGNYRVKATNSEGTTSQDFTINILYGAGITDAPTQTYEDGTLRLHCVIYSNPPVGEEQAQWTRDGYDMSRTSKTVEGSGNSRTLTLTIPDVVRDDIGTFTCAANNSFGAASKDYTVNPVPFSPVIDKAAGISKSAAKTRDDGIIKCKLEAFPQPTVTWSKGGNTIAANNIKYSTSVDVGGSIEFSFVLTIKNVKEEDYGTYTCVATTDRGTDTHDYTLTGTSKPDPPTDIEVLNVTDTAVVLTWVPGFDGGLTQAYTIRYNIPGEGFLYADAPAPPFTVTGLQSESTYEITVRASNDLGESGFTEQIVTATTNVTPTVVATVTRPEEPMFIVIMALAVVGGLLLIVTTVLICVFVRRRRRRKSSEDSTSQTNTVEMYGTHDGSYFNDDARSYSTYEKGLDDDYAKHYEADNHDNQIKQSTENGTYISPRNVPVANQPNPWAKSEDPLGNSGTYGRRQQSVPSMTSTDVQYTQNLRELDRAMHYQQPVLPHQPVERPAFVRGRPSAPRAPGRVMGLELSNDIYSSAPSIPNRNYSPLLESCPTPDSMKGDLV